MSDQLDYVGVCRKCRSLRAWISVDCPKKEIADFCREMVKRDHISLERMATEDARKADWECRGGCERKPVEPLELAL